MMLDHILMNSTTIDVASQPPSALALNQLSEEDRKLVAKLKDTYPSHILESVFGDIVKASERMGRREYHSPRESTGSSTLYLATTSTDGETYCSSSSASRSSYGSQQDQSLYKRRALSQSRSRSGSKSIPRGFLPRTSSVSSMTTEREPKEIRITITKPPQQQNAPANMNFPSNDVKTLYFCTNCQKSFQERSEWQEHEDELHERQYFWTCMEDGCDKVFNQEESFVKHHLEDHFCEEDCGHALEARRPLPSKRSWACGFDRCKGFFSDWETRCEHVAGHFESLAKEDDTSSQPSEWKYTNMIRNLLRQADVKEAYMRVMTKSHGDDKFIWPKMRWQRENTVELKRRLEYRDFREGVQQLARMACQLGHPAQVEAVKVMDTFQDTPVHSLPLASPLLPNPHFLHIDKFPRPGQNPFDVYGPVPPSPIIQLDFVADANKPDPEVKQPMTTTHKPVQAMASYRRTSNSSANHSSKSSLSAVPYSLYPAPTPVEKDLPQPPLPHISSHIHSPSLSSPNSRPNSNQLPPINAYTKPAPSIEVSSDYSSIPEGPPTSATMATVSTVSSFGSVYSQPDHTSFFPSTSTATISPLTPPANPDFSTASAYPLSGNRRTPVQSPDAASPIQSTNNSPPRPKTPKSFILKTLIRRKSEKDINAMSSHIPEHSTSSSRTKLVISEPFDADKAMERIQQYRGRGSG